MKYTIKDVAEKAGVSIATVSRVLNNRGGFSVKTKTKIDNAISDLNYKPNSFARNLVKQESKTIGVLYPFMHGKFSVSLLKGIDQYTHKLGYSVIMCNTDNDGIKTLDYIKLLSEKQVEGVIFASSTVTPEFERELKKLNVPVVLISTFTETNSIPSINIDNYKAAYDAVTKLINDGHKNIGMINGTKSNKESSQPREKGYRQALIDNKLKCPNSYIYYGNYTFESGILGAEKLLTTTDITALFVASDTMALGVLNYVYKKRIIIPHELAVVGFDDSDEAKMSVPPLTTVHQPIEEMGILAVKMLLDSETPLENIILNHSLVLRDTTKI